MDKKVSWVRAQTGLTLNEKVDQLAKEVASQVKSWTLHYTQLHSKLKLHYYMWLNRYRSSIKGRFYK